MAEVSKPFFLVKQVGSYMFSFMYASFKVLLPEVKSVIKLHVTCSATNVLVTREVRNNQVKNHSSMYVL